MERIQRHLVDDNDDNNHDDDDDNVDCHHSYADFKLIHTHAPIFIVFYPFSISMRVKKIRKDKCRVIVFKNGMNP